MKSFLVLFLLVAATVLRAATATVTEGVSKGVTISVTANGTMPFSYQWRKAQPNQAPQPIAGATAATFVIPNPKVTDSGIYSVVVSNSAGSTVSDDAVVTVRPPPPTNSRTEISKPF